LWTASLTVWLRLIGLSCTSNHHHSAQCKARRATIMSPATRSYYHFLAEPFGMTSRKALIMAVLFPTQTTRASQLNVITLKLDLS
jgi:hypothetical protein